MLFNSLEHLVLFLFLIVTADARVRYYPFHPAVLTRPSPTTTTAPTATPTTPAPPRTTTPATVTTPEPPEQEEGGTTWHTSGDLLTHTLTTSYFGTTLGGGDGEWEDEMTTQQFWLRPTTTGQVRRTTTTTPAPTTPETTEEPPENEDRQGQGQHQGHSSSNEPKRGLCFCTPYEYCPRGSIPRGGLCWDMSWYTLHPYIRCCYPPSQSRRRWSAIRVPVFQFSDFEL